MRKLKTIIGYGLLGMAVVAFGGQKEVPPEGGTPKDFVLPLKKTLTLDNGLSATLVPFGTLPKVLVLLTVRCGNLNETADQIWLADMTAKMMKEGTQSRSAQEVAAAAAQMGGEISLQVGPDLSTIRAEVLSEFGGDMVRLIADIVRHPLLPDAEIGRLKNDFLRQLSLSESQAETLAQAELDRVLYGDHPYGRVLSTPEIIRSFTPDKVREFYRANFGALRSHVYVVGRFDLKAVSAAIEQAFGDWKRGPEPLILPPRVAASRAVTIVDRPGSQQSVLNIGVPAVDPSQGDWMAFQVTNAVLGGGGFLSRITSNIREDKGYTYSPYSLMAWHYRSAHWVQFASVGNEVTAGALREILYEIDRLRKQPPSPEELERIQNFLAGTFVLQNSSRGGIAAGLSFVDLQGRDPSYLSTWVHRVRAVTPQDVQAIAQRYFRPEDITIVVVGDESRIKDSLKEFGSIVEAR